MNGGRKIVEIAATVRHPTSTAERFLTAAARLALTGLLGVMILAGLLRVFDFSRLADYGEGTLLGMVQRLRQEPISTAWLHGPELTLTSYGPAFYWGVQAVSAITPRWQKTLIPGRLLSLAATLATAALIAWTIARRARNIEPGVLAAMLFLAAPPVHAWGTTHRVDALALLPALGAYLLVGSRGIGASGRVLSAAALLGSAACAALGSLAKQTAALAAIGVVVYLLVNRQFRAAAIYAILVAAMGLAAWFILNRATGGYFFTGAVRGNLCAMSLRSGFWAGYAMLATPLCVAAAAVAVWLFVRQPRRALRSVYWIGLPVSLLIASGLSCKEGATASYYLEACALATLLVGQFGLARLWPAHRGRALTAGLLLAGAVAVPDLQFVRQHGLCLPDSPYGAAMIAKQLQTSPGAYVLADGQHISAVLEAGCRPLVNDSFLFRVLADHGAVSPAAVIQAMEQGRVPLLVLKRTVESHRQQVGTASQKWPAAVVDAMQRYYALEAEGDDIFIYRRRNAASGR